MKKYGIITVALLTAAGIAVYFYFGARGDEAPNSVLVTRGTVSEEVNVTGKLKSSRTVELSLELSGKVASVRRGVGDRVLAGETIMTLDSSRITADLEKAEALLETERIKLEELKQGTRIEEIRVQEVKVEGARASLDDAKKNLYDKLHDAYTKSDDAVRYKVDQFFSNPRSQDPQLNFPTSGSLGAEVEHGRLSIEARLLAWKESLDQLSLSSNVPFFVLDTKAHLEAVRAFLDQTALLVNGLTPSAGITQTTTDGWKTDVSTARTNVNTALANVTTAEKELQTQETALLLAREELTLKKAGPTPEQLSAQEALIRSGEAAVRSIKTDLSRTVLRAPFSGVITRQDAKVGAIVSANTPIVSLISEALFEIETYIPEADIAKVFVGGRAEVTLDAYGNDVLFAARVSFIDPAETVIEGVSTYKTTLHLSETDDRVKSGMTADIDIFGEQNENVLSIPQRAVIARNGERIVRILEGEIIREVTIETGLRGSDGTIEIISGLKEGDRVVLY